MTIFEKTFIATNTEQLYDIFDNSFSTYVSLITENGSFDITIKYSEELKIKQTFIKNGSLQAVATGNIQYHYNGKRSFILVKIEEEVSFPIEIIFKTEDYDEEKEPSHEVLYRRDKTRQNFVPFSWNDIPVIDGSEQLQAIINMVFNTFYPVGSIYISTNPNPPNFGVWKQIKDTFLIAVGDDFEALTESDYSTKELGPVGGSTDTVLPIHQHQIKGYTTEMVSLKHSHTPAIRTNNNYTHKDYGGWIGVVPNNNCTTSQAKSVAESGIGQQGYVTTNQASTPNKSCPFSPYAANLTDFFWGNYTNTVDTSHKHDLPTMVTNSITGYGEDGGKLVNEENLKNTNIPPYLPVYMWRRMSDPK